MRWHTFAIGVYPVQYGGQVARWAHLCKEKDQENYVKVTTLPTTSTSKVQTLQHTRVQAQKRSDLRSVRYLTRRGKEEHILPGQNTFAYANAQDLKYTTASHPPLPRQRCREKHANTHLSGSALSSSGRAPPPLAQSTQFPLANANDIMVC